MEVCKQTYSWGPSANANVQCTSDRQTDRRTGLILLPSPFACEIVNTTSPPYIHVIRPLEYTAKRGGSIMVLSALEA